MKLVNYNIITGSGLCNRCIFSIQVASPEKAGAYKERPSKDTQFKKFYERGDFPIALENDKKGNKIAWKVSKHLLSIV